MKQDSRFIKFLKLIWPAFYKILNTVLYFLISFIKGFFRQALQMIKGG